LGCAAAILPEVQSCCVGSQDQGREGEKEAAKIKQARINFFDLLFMFLQLALLLLNPVFDLFADSDIGALVAGLF